MANKGLSVSEVARLSKVSVRTLHHYDEIGLFSPAGRSAAGYRLYSRQDLERLQQILFYRELGLPLEEIRRVLTDPAFDRRAALLEQRQLVANKIEHFQRIRGAIERALVQEGSPMSASDPPASSDAQPATSAELFEVFGRDPAEHEEEVEQRWGQTEAHQESKRRTTKYTKAQWQAIQDEGNQIVADLAAVMDRQLPATDPAAMDIAERHRQHTERWFYPCSRAMHAGLGQMYVSDPRFSAFYDAVRPGLASYASAAWQANAART